MRLGFHCLLVKIRGLELVLRYIGGAGAHGGEGGGMGYGAEPWLPLDLAAVSHLDEVRSADLKQLRNDLNVVEPEQSLGMFC